MVALLLRSVQPAYAGQMNDHRPRESSALTDNNVIWLFAFQSQGLVKVWRPRWVCLVKSS